MIKKVCYIVLTFVGVFLTQGCSKSEETAEGVVAEITSEQMEAAKAGRNAAKAIVSKEWKDSMQLQQAILEARAINSKYELEGKTKCKETFDTAFMNTIRTVRPELASQLQP